MTDLNFTITVMTASGLTVQSKLKRKPNAFVEMKWTTGDKNKHVHRTQIVKSTTEPLWEEGFFFHQQTADAIITFEIIDKGFGLSHSYGVVERKVSDLLAMEEDRGDVTFPSCGANLSIKVQKESREVVASEILADAQKSSEHFFHTPDKAKLGTSAYSSLGEVVNSLSKMMEVVDSFATVHPYVNVAWKTVSSVYRVIKNQLDRDDKICDLLQTMATLYTFVTPLEAMRHAHEDLESSLADILKQILQQTIECSLFVQEYAGKGFAGRSIKNTFSTTDARIGQFHEAFIYLGKSLDTGLGVQGTLVSFRTAAGVRELVLFNQLKPAVMEWTGRPTCHPKTRLDVLRFISDWVMDASAPSKVLWLTGLAGAGKSTLATTIANFYAETQRLGAFVFFDRDVKERSDPLNVLRTLAYELSRFDKRIAQRVSRAVDQNAHIAQMQLDAQFRDLIRTPLQSVTTDESLSEEGPIVIVIDSLDECGNPANRNRLLSLLAKDTIQLPSVFRVIITSRYETDIQMAFSKQAHIHRHELEVLPNDGDIKVYMESQFTEISEKNYLDEDWPGEDKLGALVRRAGGLFIWASTACKYIDGYDPEGAVEELLTGEGFNDGLDDLYNKALQGAGDWKVPRFQKDFQAIFGLILVAKNPISPNAIDKLLNVKSLRVVSRFGSVLHQKGPEDPIRILHKSFSEYISDPDRCGNPLWMIKVSHHEYQAAVICINLLEKAFATPHRFVLDEEVKSEYDEAVTYACSFWIQHVIEVEGDERPKMATLVHKFMKSHIMRWLEATSVLETSRSTPNLLEQLHSWASDVGNEEMMQLAYDAYRFATFFTETIAEHPAMVMQVALPFIPLESQLYKLYHNPLEYPTVLGGYQKQWSPSLRVFPLLDTSVISAAFSPDMTKVVSTGARFDDDSPINGDENNCVRCWDVATGTEAMPRVELEFTSIARFSPDGAHVWVATGRGTVYVLDSGTGDELSELSAEKWVMDSSDSGSNASSRTQSPVPSRPSSAMHHAVSLDSGLPHAHGISQSESALDQQHDDNAKAHDANSVQSSPRAGSLPLGTTDGGDNDTEMDVEGGFTRAAFSDDGRWIAFGDDSGQIFVVDRDAGKQAYGILDDCSALEWREVVRMFPSIVFSPDSSIFAAGAGDGNIYIYKSETGEKIVNLEGHTNEITLLSFSPDGEKLYSGSEDGNIRTWDPTSGECITSIMIHDVRKFQPMAFAPDGRMASTSADGTIQIWDSATGEEVGPVLQGHFNAVSAMTFSNDGTKLVSGAFKNNIQTWDVSGSGKTDLIKFSRHDRPPHKVKLSPSGLIVRSWRPDQTKFWSSVTGRELIMDPYDKSAQFKSYIGAKQEEEDSSDEEDGQRKDESKKKPKDKAEGGTEDPDAIITDSGDPVELKDPQPDAKSDTSEEKWADALKSADPEGLSLTYKGSEIFYHPAKTISIEDDTIKYSTSGKHVWSIPLEFRHRSHDIRPNFIAFGIWNGRVFVIHLPQKLIDRNAQG